jgi:PucR C-terminal helix-turn-helix domain
MSTLRHEPWRALPPEVALVIEPEMPALLDAILSEIAQEVPEYARPLEGNFGRGIRLGVEEALRQFVDLVADPDRGRAQGREVYRGLGRGEMREGRSLDALQAAYRIGARVAWRRLADAGLRAQLAPDVLCSLADAIFAYIDELAADSVEGFAHAQQAAAGERERRRRLLLTVLLDERFDSNAVRPAAADADWEPPREVALLACEPEDLDSITRRLPMDTLAGGFDELGCVVIGDPSGPGRGRQLEAACAGRPAALGPVQPLDQARASWTRARSGLAAIRAGALPAELCRADEHLAGIAFFEARAPLRELASQRLEPLNALTPAARERMAATLKAYLDHRGNAPAMAAALHVHPQTVRYRLRKLRELFGATLEDPEARFELETAVRVR